MFHAPMVDLKREAKAEKVEEAMPSSIAGPEYPYGCCLSLEDEQLDKLGLDGDLPAVGEMVHGCFVAKVTCASINQSTDGDGKPQEHRRVELQIIQMGIPGANQSKSERWYGGEDAEPGE